MQKLSTDNADVTFMLFNAGLRPTRQRLLLGNLLFSQGCRHVTAEALHNEAKAAGVKVSLATVYNTLHQFTEAKLLREVNVEGGQLYFDTNTSSHHHFLCEESGKLTDIPEDDIVLAHLPIPPKGMDVSSVDVIIKLRPAR